jgi:Histidine kinase/Histidine kinase-, DNA gyrase B-, and HSP90-like ATPase
MDERAVQVSSAVQGVSAERTRPARGRRVVLICAGVWTIFVGVSLWWLLRGNVGPQIRFVHEAKSLLPPGAGRVQGLVTTDMGFQRLYPWLLLGPYIFLVASWFPLERGRLWLHLPLNVVACGAFLAASHGISAHTRMLFTKVTIVSSGPTGKEVESVTNREQAAGSVEIGRAAALEGPAARAESENTPRRAKDQRPLDPSSDTNVGNLLLRVRYRSDLPRFGMRRFDLWSVLLDLLAYGAIAGLAHSVHFYRRFRERENRALFLESNLAHARLSTLRAQLQPHFLFNSLNAIAALLRRDPRLAEATLISLSELLRLALSHSETQEVSLREELRFVECYLSIQRTRFGQRLRVEEDIEPAALECFVPTLVLQPLVENAIRHGIEPAEKPGLVRLTARRRDGRLELTVEDDGVGLGERVVDLPALKITNVQASALPSPIAKGPAPATGVVHPRRTGIGLANLQARLETLYGTNQRLELAPRPQGGLTVRVEIPWRAASTPGNSSLPGGDS